MPKRTIQQPLSQNKEQPPTVSPSYAMETDIADFMLDRRVKRISAKTAKWYIDALKKFRLYCASVGIYRTSDINARALRLYLAHLEETGHNPGGISNLYRAVRAYLRWCVEEYGISSLADALRKVSSPPVSTEPLEPIALDHVAAMLAQCTPRTYTGERDKALLYVLLDTGIRHAELTDLAVGDVNLEDGSVLIRDGKGGKSRTVFIGLKARRAVINYLRQRDSPLINAMRKRHGIAATDALWLTDEGTPLTKNGVRQIVVRRARQAGLPEPGLHEFRRAFAVNSLRNGMDVITLQRLLGHSTLAIINRYLKLLSEDLKKSHEKYGVVDNL
jgi:integrase/recombinase XerD